MLNKDLPSSTKFCIMMTDYCKPEGVYKPRMDCSDWGGWGGKHEAAAYPATRPYNETAACKSKITATRWKSPWVKFYKHLNRHWLWGAFDVANGIINNVNGQIQVEPPYDIDSLEKMPKFENISFVGSIHIAEEVTDTGVKIKTWHYSDVPDMTLNFTNSVMISKFTGIMKGTGVLTNLYEEGEDCYLPVCVRDGYEAWIDRVEVELFPDLGIYYNGDRDLVIRSGPGTEFGISGVLPANRSFEITRYHPAGYDVWGQVLNGWIPLRYQTTFGAQSYIEPTTWYLETVPGRKPFAHSIAGQYGYVSPYTSDYVDPDPEEALYQVKVICTALNVRSGPSVSYGKVGVVVYDDVLDVYDEEGDWLRIGAGRWVSGKSPYVELIGEEDEISVDFRNGWDSFLDELEDTISDWRL